MTLGSLSAILTLGASEPSLLRDLVVVLAVAAVVAVLFQRLRLEAIPAYLVGGALVGPHLLGVVDSPETLRSISNLAIVLLMFGIGLQLSTGMFRNAALWLIGVGALSNLLMILIGWPLAMALGLDVWPALAVAMAFSNSSTAVVLRIVAARRELHHASGRLIVSTLIVQDLIVVVLLAVIPYLARLHAAGLGDAAATMSSDTMLQALQRIGGVVLLIVLGKILLPRILKEAARGRSAEVMTVLSVAIALAAAGATQAMGFSPALGAFIAGFLLSGTPFRFQLSGQIGPARDLFIAVFFTTVGMNIDPAAALSWWWLIALAAVITCVVKALSMAATSWALGAPASTGVMVGLGLCQASEFTLVMLAVADAEGMLTPTAMINATTVVVLTLFVTPALFNLGRRVGNTLHGAPQAPWIKASPLSVEDIPKPDGEADALKPAILCGYGIVGRAVAEELDKAGVRFTLIELNPQTVSTQQRLGRRAIYGDASSADVLESAGIQDAGALILTLPDEEAALRACATARRLNPDIFIAARTNFAGRGHLAQGLGANYVVVEEIAAAHAMQREIIKRLRADAEQKRRRDDEDDEATDEADRDIDA